MRTLIVFFDLLAAGSLDFLASGSYLREHTMLCVVTLENRELQIDE